MKPRLSALAAALALTAFAGHAVPARPGVRAMALPDGSTIHLSIAGDEFMHSRLTSDGLTVRRAADGFFYYALPDGISSVRAHDPSERTAAEKSFVASAAKTLTLAAHYEGAPGQKARRARSVQGVKRTSQVPSSGSPRVPIVLVEYSDYKFKDSDPNATFRGFFREGEKSAYQYFSDQSNGKYTPQFDVYGPVTLTGKRADYGGNDPITGETDLGLGRMVAEGCLGLDSEIDFSRYDNDGDGVCDVVIVLYAGDGEASSFDPDSENAIWPCQYELGASDYGKDLYLDRTTISKFAVFNELNGFDLRRIDGIGTFCHEFSHCLDLPDFYDTNYGNHFGMGYWSLMDTGPYNDEGYTPIGYSAYEKSFMGWISLEEATENTFYTLPPLNTGDDRAITLTNPDASNEYYVLEARKRQGWDAYMPAEGLMITHVTYNAIVWENNEVNNYNPQCMTIIPADNSLKVDFDGRRYAVNYEDHYGDLWPYAGNNALTDTSVPAAKLNYGTLMGKPVTDITRLADGSVEFWAMKGAAPAVAAPVITGHEELSDSSFDLVWSPGDDNEVTYVVEVKEHQDVAQVSHTDFSSQEHGWKTDGYTEISTAENAIRLGSARQLGSIESPLFRTGADGAVSVSFNAKYYSSDGCGVLVSAVDAAGTVLDYREQALTGQYADYTVILDAGSDIDVSIIFETPANKERCYIRTVDLYTGNINDAPAMSSEWRMERSAAGETYRLLTDITDTRATLEGMRSPVTYDCRVKAVAADKDNFSDSPWSKVHTFVFGKLSVATMTDADTDEAVAEYYSVQGYKVDSRNLIPGIYIRRRGSESELVRIR